MIKNIDLLEDYLQEVLTEKAFERWNCDLERFIIDEFRCVNPVEQYFNYYDDSTGNGYVYSRYAVEISHLDTKNSLPEIFYIAEIERNVDDEIVDSNYYYYLTLNEFKEMMQEKGIK